MAKMATKVLQAQWQINNFTQIFVKKLLRPFIVDAKLISVFRKTRITKGFYELDGRLYASYKLPKQPVNSLLEMLIRLPDKNYHFDAGC